jgi:hypothetical protein
MAILLECPITKKTALIIIANKGNWDYRYYPTGILTKPKP